MVVVDILINELILYRSTFNMFTVLKMIYFDTDLAEVKVR